MNKTGFAFHEHCLWHDTGPCSVFDAPGGFIQPGTAAENPETKRRFKNLLDVSGLSELLTPIKGALAEHDDLRRFHTPDYLQRLATQSDQQFGEAGLCAPFRQDAFHIARLSAGHTIATLESVLKGEVDNAYCLTRPPGHHAESHQGNGFCLLGNIPIAIKAAQAKGLVNRVVVVDWDVHHGNGTQEAFYDNADVLTISIHHDNNYPIDSGAVHERGDGPGFGYNLNVPLPAGSGIGAYKATIEQIVEPAIKRFQPELIVIACGFDASAMDPLGCMILNAETYHWMTKRMMQCAADTCGGKLAMIHEGGYSEGYVPFCGHAVIEALSNAAIHVPDPLGADIARWGQQSLQPHQQALLSEISLLLNDIH
ncbi:class II histone deacetylase (plasmid) [Photobacterium sp. GJ3]|uniref:class II histone deacetylase n=1 Tax=Photobacterium sp. GJ3 TaxID=2829502 RepID=UPI001B8AECAA|nr:class II histone deacetylase [Photobacterium sp. GJ3]QUJ69867.1 class II histone deacetylase [Photobacterium sp. GJ3]